MSGSLIREDQRAIDQADHRDQRIFMITEEPRGRGPGWRPARGSTHSDHGTHKSGIRSIVNRYRMRVMKRSASSAAPAASDGLDTLGRSSGPASLILSSLADGAKHGYALTKDIESFAGVRLGPGTLYEALSRLEAHGLIEAVDSDDRRRPYRLTSVGATALKAHLAAQARVTEVGLRRLAVNWSTPTWGTA